MQCGNDDVSVRRRGSCKTAFHNSLSHTTQRVCNKVRHRTPFHHTEQGKGNQEDVVSAGDGRVRSGFDQMGVAASTDVLLQS